jgi:hypothetical protein
VVTYARTVIIVAGVLTALLALQAGRLTVRFDPDATFPPDDPVVQLDSEIRAQFGGRNLVVIAVVPHQGTVWTPDVLAAVRDVTLAVRDLPGVMDHAIVSLAAPTVRHVEVSPDGIREEYLMRQVPDTAEGIARLREVVMADPLLRGGVVADDEHAALVLADFWPGTEAEAIARRLADVAARAAGPTHHIHVTGEPLFAAAGDAYARTVPLYLAGAVGVMMLVLLVFFRTWQGMALPIATGLLATLWGLGLMAATGVPLGVWNQSVPTLVVIVAAGHSAQMLKRYYEERERIRDNGRAVAEALVRTAPVMLAAGATAALGFASMSLFGVPGMVHLGLSAAYGIASAVVLELSFMPALRVCLRPQDPSPSPRRTAFARLGAALGAPRGRTAILAVAVATLVWATAGAPRLRPAGSTREYLPRGHELTRDLETIQAHFPGTVAMGILFDGPPGSATVLATLRAIERLERALATDPNVARTASLAGLVAQLNAVFTPGRARELPADPALAAQLLFLGRGPAFERFVDRADSRTVVWAYLRSDAPGAVRRVMHLARREAAALELPAGGAFRIAGGQGPMEAALDERVTRGKLLTIGALLVVIYALASFVLGSGIGGAFVLVPLVLAAAVTFGILAWSGLPLDLITSSLLAMSVAIGADYAIYFLHRVREERRRGRALEAAVERALDTSGRAVAFVAVSIALGFTVFSASPYGAFRLAGWLTPAGMLASSAAALSVMPALLLALRPAFLGRRTDGASLDNAPASRAVGPDQ